MEVGKWFFLSEIQFTIGIAFFGLDLGNLNFLLFDLKFMLNFKYSLQMHRSILFAKQMDSAFDAIFGRNGNCASCVPANHFFWDGARDLGQGRRRGQGFWS